MKILTSILTILLMVTGCTAQEDPTIEQDPGKFLSEADQKYLSVLIGPNWNQTNVIGNAFHHDKTTRPPTPPLFEAKYGLFTSRMHGSERLEWNVADDIIRSHLDPILGEEEDFTDEEIKYTHSIQSISTKFLKHYLVKEAQLREVGESIHYYLEVLYRHQGKTLYVMTDALEHAKPVLKRKEYKKYRNYVIQQVSLNLREVEEKWEEYYELYKASEHWERAKYLHYGKRLQNMSEEAQYIKNKLGTNF